MKMRRLHRPGASRFGASSVTALSGVAALAALVHPAPNQVAPGQQDQAVSAATQTQTTATADDFRLAMAQVRAARHADAAMPLYTVRSGDTMSGVAYRKCDHQANRWTGIYAESRKEHLTGKNANVLAVGQLLAINCEYIPAELKYAPAPPPPPPPVQVQATTTSVAAPVRHTYQALPSGSGGESGLYGAALSSYGRCVIARESGGNSQVMNSSGHYGLYQFSASTWQAYGGSAADFGRASAAEQTRVFNNAIAQGGQSNWSPYDGC